MSVVHSFNEFEVSVASLWKYLVHVETIISSVLLVFSQMPFPSLAFACFLLTKLMNMWGSGGKKWGLQMIQAGPVTENWRDFQNVGHTVAGTAGWKWTH